MTLDFFCAEGLHFGVFFSRFHLASFLMVQVKETKKAVKDSRSGVQKMAVGHHIGNNLFHTSIG